MKSRVIKTLIAATCVLFAVRTLHASQMPASGDESADDVVTPIKSPTPEESATTETAGPAGISTGQGDGFFPGGRGASGIAGGQFNYGREVSSNGLMITWSENNDEVRGFSNSKGDWEILTIVKQERIIPVVGDEVAAVRIGDSMAAFSAAKAQWDVIKLSEDSKAVPVVFKGYVKVEDNGHLYTFADAKGQWTSPTDPELQPATKQLALKRIESDDDRAAFDQWLHSLPLYKGRGIRLMFQNGEVTVHTTRQSWMTETLAALEEFSREPDSSGAESTTLPGSALNIDQIESDISKLRDEFKALELAVRDGVKKDDSSADGRDDQQRELRRLVERSFDLRQQLQRLEAQRMKLKLQLIETNLDAREKAREAIVERRMTELRNGNVQPAATIQSQNFGLPITGTPIRLAGPPHIPVDGPGPGMLNSGNLRPANPDDRMQWPQPAEMVKELRKYRSSFMAYQSQLQAPAKRVEKWSGSLESLKAEGHLQADATEEQREQNLAASQRELVIHQSIMAQARNDWGYAWASYQSKVRLLKMDVEEAELAVGSKTSGLDRMQKLAAAQAVSSEELRNAESEAVAAKYKLARAEELLKLYADIETQEPDLNPDSLNAEK